MAPTSSSILPTSSTPPSTTPPTTKPAPRNLPKTGSDTAWLLTTGGALLALGASLVAWAHRRRFG